MGSLFDADSWIHFETPPPPYPMLQYEETMSNSGRRRRPYSLEDSLRECEYALEECEYALEESEDMVLLLEREKAKAIKEAKKAHSKMVAAEQRAKAEKARAAELEQSMFATIRKSKEAQKSSSQAHSKIVEEATRRRVEKLQETIERMRIENEKKIFDLQSRDKKVKDQLITGCAHLWECLHLMEKEVAKVVSEKEELKAKVEELSKALETSRLEEEYDKVEYQGLETWECCKVDDEESDS